MPIDAVLGSIFSATFVAAIVRVSTPLLLPALGGLLAELGGVINIALEGQMLVAAFTGVMVGASAPQWLPGLPAPAYACLGALAGVLAAVFLAGLMAFFHLELQADLILTGLAINILAAGLTVFLLFALTGDKGSTAGLASPALPTLRVPFASQIPIAGTLLNGEQGTGYHLLSYVALLLVPALSIFLVRTRAGIHLRATGEQRSAAATAGIHTRRMQYAALLGSGALAALGGIYLSMGYLTLFQANMTAGRGFIALAIVSLGGRRPAGVLAASLLFGTATALAAKLGTLAVPAQVVEMVPPAVTILALVLYQLRRRARLAATRRRFQEQAL